jgi:hypothetical protein
VHAEARNPSEDWGTLLATFKGSLPDHQRRVIDTVLEILRAKGRRINQSDLIAQGGRKTPESTTKSVLAAAVRVGILTSRPSDRPGGYGLPEWDRK